METNKHQIVDNFTYIGSILNFDDPDKFYFIELLQRKKDNNEFAAKNRLIKYYVVRSLDYFKKIEQEIKNISDLTGARVYINLNRRSFKTCTLQMLRTLADYVASENNEGIINLFQSICGKFSSEGDNKMWILDIDPDEETGKLPHINYLNKMINFIETECEPFNDKKKFMYTIPTVNGFHFIFHPFNLQKFSSLYPNISVHKDNPTLLYFKSKG